MNNLALKVSNAAYFSPLISKNREWPFQGYAEQIQELVKYFGRKLLMSRKGFDATNPREHRIIGLINIPQQDLRIGDSESPYPHSLLFSDWSATNLSEVGFVGTNARLGKLMSKIEPGHLIYSGEEGEKRLDEAKRILNNNAIYWNPVLFQESVEIAKHNSEVISEMSRKALAMGMFD